MTIGKHDVSQRSPTPYPNYSTYYPSRDDSRTSYFQDQIPQEQAQTYPIEGWKHPFGFTSIPIAPETLQKAANTFPDGKKLSISFSRTNSSKFLGYIPIIGTIVGIQRLVRGIFEFMHFRNNGIEEFEDRSFLWITRGIIELFPIAGGIICLINDIFATCLFNTEKTIFIDN